MQQTPQPWNHFLGIALLGAFLALLVPLGATAEMEITSEMNEKIRGALEKLPESQAQELLNKAGHLTPTQRLETVNRLSANQNQEATRPSQEMAPTTSTQKDAPNRPPPAPIMAGLFSPELTLFGHDLFVNAPSSFVPDTKIPIPEDYLLGPGDSVIVQLSGKAFQQHTMVIDREGVLTFPGIGPLSVTGMHFQALKEMLTDRVQKQMLGTEVARVTLGSLRSLQVFILGDVPHPGSYTVNSLTTVTNAIFSSGGIKPIGSMRTIQVKRQGKIFATLDLYDLLLRGDQSADVRLQSGDIIFVPPIGTVIAVTGRVKRPGIYELLAEKNVEESINLVGGTLPDADPAHVKLDRFQSRQKRILLDLDITQPKQLRFRIQSGDTIHIPPVPQTKKEIVLLTGSVTNPGAFQWKKGLNITDIVLFKNLLPQTDLSYAVVTRLDAKTNRLLPLTFNLGRALEDPSSPDDMLLQPQDQIQIFGLAEDRANSVQTLVGHLQEQARFDHREQVVTLAGHVRFPGNYPFSPGMGLKDLLHAAGDARTDTDMEYTLIVRQTDLGDIEPFSVRLSKLLEEENATEDIPLQPLDHILVFQSGSANETEGTKNATDATKAMVTDNKLKPVKGLLETTRELTTEAKANKQLLGNSYRKKLLEPVLAKLRQQGSSAVPTKIVLVNGSVRNPGEYPLEINMRISDLIRAGGGTAEPAYLMDAEMSRFSIAQEQHRQIIHEKVDLGRIAQGDQTADMLLQSNDALLIKRTPQWSTVSSVTLEGEFRFPGAYPVKPGETLLQVIERAGGLTSYAYPDGAIFFRKNLKEREQKELDALASRLELEVTGRDLRTMDKEKENRSTSPMLLSLVQRLRNTVPQGRLAIDLPLMMTNASNQDTSSEIVLRDQDHLIIPQKVNEITVMGEVSYPTSHQYLPKNSIENYIGLSGGYSPMADRERLYVVKANGQVISNAPSTSTFGTAWLSGGNSDVPLRPGDTIVVPLKIERIAPMTLWKDITQILYNIAVTSATLKTVGAL